MANRAARVKSRPGVSEPRRYGYLGSYAAFAWKPECESGRKVFFFEKKKQKTSVCCGFGFSG
jgi:hypothetical protein